MSSFSADARVFCAQSCWGSSWFCPCLVRTTLPRGQPATDPSSRRTAFRQYGQCHRSHERCVWQQRNASRHQHPGRRIQQRVQRDMERLASIRHFTTVQNWLRHLRDHRFGRTGINSGPGGAADPTLPKMGTADQSHFTTLATSLLSSTVTGASIPRTPPPTAFPMGTCVC